MDGWVGVRMGRYIDGWKDAWKKWIMDREIKSQQMEFRSVFNLGASVRRICCENDSGLLSLKS